MSLCHCHTSRIVSLKHNKTQSPKYIDGLVQERRYSIDNALGLRLSCTNLSISCNWWDGLWNVASVIRWWIVRVETCIEDATFRRGLVQDCLFLQWMWELHGFNNGNDLYCIIYCIVLYHIILYHNIAYHISCHIICYITLYCNISHYFKPYVTQPRWLTKTRSGKVFCESNWQRTIPLSRQ